MVLIIIDEKYLLCIFCDVVSVINCARMYDCNIVSNEYNYWMIIDKKNAFKR